MIILYFISVLHNLTGYLLRIYLVFFTQALDTGSNLVEVLSCLTLEMIQS
jgi:hypothetical protein